MVSWILGALYLFVGYHIAQMRFKYGRKGYVFVVERDLGSGGELLFLCTFFFQETEEYEGKRCLKFTLDPWVTKAPRWAYVAVFTLVWLPAVYVLPMFVFTAGIMFVALGTVVYVIMKSIVDGFWGFFRALFRA